MSASIVDYKPQETPTAQGGERPLAQSVFSGEARLRELEHLAETARKVRDQAAAELTRGSGATHHIARDRIGAAERMLRKTQQEIAELRAQLALPVTGTGAPAEPSIRPYDFELAVMLGHEKGRFAQVGGAHAPLELQQETGLARHRAMAASRDTKQARSAKSQPWSLRTVAWVLALGLGLGALSSYAMVGNNIVSDAAHIVRDSTEELVIRIRALLPTSDAGRQGTAKAAFSQSEHTNARQPI